jgi:outer membrane protein assembly factor BamE
MIAPDPAFKTRKRHRMNRSVHLLALLGAILLLPGCESVRNWTPPLIQPYRPDMQQGNIITKEMVDQLRPGMTRDQVRFLLGTPMVKNLFQENRWDYVYYLKRGKGGEQQLRRLTIAFKDGKLDTFNADDMPPETMADNLILGKNPKFHPTPPVSKPDDGPTVTPTNRGL